MQCAPGCATSTLFAVDLRTGTTKRLTEQLLAAWWLPDRIVAFAPRDGRVDAAPFDVKTLTFERTPTEVFSGVRGTALGADMVVSAAGTVVYASGNGSSAFVSEAMPVWVSRAGSATAIDTAWRVPGSAVDGGIVGCRLALSPDGDRLAIAVLRDGLQADVWVKQLARPPLTTPS